MTIRDYAQKLYDCRFCTMCKPYGEVSSVTKDEAHSTRVCSMLLWQVADGKAQWDEHISKIVYESSLNSVNQVWCLDHNPVPQYILAARADLVEAGLEPARVKEYRVPLVDGFMETLESYTDSSSEVVFYPGDALAAGDPNASIAALKLVTGAGQKLKLPSNLHDSGAVAYCLGKINLVREQAALLIDSLQGAKEVVVDGPLSEWVMTRVYPALGIKLPGGVKVKALNDWLVVLHSQGKFEFAEKNFRVFIVGSEFSRLLDNGYSNFRRLLLAVPGLDIVEPLDGLELAHSSGASGGLFIAAPTLAAVVSQQRVDEAQRIGAQWIICDSPLDAAHLRSLVNDAIQIGTFAEFVAPKHEV